MDNTRWRVIESQLKSQVSQLPLGVNPRTQILGWWLQQQQSDSLYKVQLALNTLMEHGTFMYTLSPTPLGAQANDDFLFNTRQGFCQHFALSFGLLMRAAGVPTRLVNGYLGGEINTLNNLWMLREKQAHVWADVWLEQADGTGAWQRVDPTAL
jgi:transglutaminase-like putative cysteine protease